MLFFAVFLLLLLLQTTMHATPPANTPEFHVTVFLADFFLLLTSLYKKKKE